MDTRLTFCSLHLQQWMTFSRFLFVFSVSSFNPHHLADHIHQIKGLLMVWQRHSTLQLPQRFVCLVYKHNMYRNTDWICFWLRVLFHCCKQSIQVSHIHYAYAIMIIIIIINFIIILIVVVLNILFIHKSWQQIRHGDAHESRTQNSKAVQRMNLYLQ